MTKKTSTVRFHEQALAGQVRDAILAHLKTMNKPWAKLPEAEQQALIESSEKVATDMVAEAIDVVTGSGAVSIKANVKNVTVKDDVISGTVTIDRNEPDGELYLKAAHGTCQLSFATNRSSLVNTGETPEPEADQPAMFTEDDRASRPKSAPVTDSGDELSKARARKASKTGKKSKVEDTEENMEHELA